MCFPIARILFPFSNLWSTLISLFTCTYGIRCCTTSTLNSYSLIRLLLIYTLRCISINTGSLVQQLAFGSVAAAVLAPCSCYYPLSPLIFNRLNHPAEVLNSLQQVFFITLFCPPIGYNYLFDLPIEGLQPIRSCSVCKHCGFFLKRE